MSKRKKAADLLSKSSAIDAQFQNAHKPRAADKFRRKTYLLNDDLINRMAIVAASHKVGVNDMARYLLEHVLTLAESGQVEIETAEIPADDRPGYTKTIILT